MCFFSSDAGADTDDTDIADVGADDTGADGAGGAGAGDNVNANDVVVAVTVVDASTVFSPHYLTCLISLYDNV